MNTIVSIGGEKNNKYYLKFENEHVQVWDVLAFRPDPKSYLRSGQNYPAKLTFKKIKNRSLDKAVLVPQNLIVDVNGKAVRFINIRLS